MASPATQRATVSFTVPTSAQGHRLDSFLSEKLPDLSREKIKKALQQGACTVDGQSVTLPKTRLLVGQEVSLQDAIPQDSGLIVEEGPIDLIWHDSEVAVLNKPAGLTVHPCPSCTEGTLVHRLLGYFPQLLAQEGLRPGIVHRLDKDTSGLLIIALSEASRLHLSEAFAQREVHKEYLCIVHGVPAPSGDIHEPLGRHPSVRVKMAIVPESQGGKAAQTSWRLLHADPAGRFALLAVQIFTGRTHQIRVHMAHVGHPLWGDKVYGPAAPKAAKGMVAFCPRRQMLHAWKLSFPHPVSGEECQFACPPPPDFLECLEQLSRRVQRVVITGVPGSGKSALGACLAALTVHGQAPAAGSQPGPALAPVPVVQEAIPVWSADAVLRDFYAPGADAWIFLRRRYGDRFVPADDAPVDRPALRQAMDENPAIRREVEACTHGLARHSLETFWQQCAQEGRILAVAEVPLYLEARWKEADPLPPVVVGVDCPREIREQRVASTRGWSAATLAAIEAWQWPAARKLAACDSLVDNSGTLEDLHQQAQKLLTHLAALRSQHHKDCAHLARLWESALVQP